MNKAVFVIILSFGALRADALGDLRSTLQGLRGQDPVRGNVEYQFTTREGDAKAPRQSQGKAGAWVEADGGGLRIFWSRQLLEQADQEDRARAKDPEREAPTRRAMSALSPSQVSGCLGAAEALLQELEKAQVLEERPESYEGQPARCLTLKLEPSLSQQDRKYVKEFQAKARVWLGPDGVPLGTERELSLKGRAFLVISFEQKEKEALRFAKVGHRLVTLRHQSERSGSGGGERGETRSTTTLTLKN